MATTLLNEICADTDVFIASMPKEKRKEYGQFFTSRETAFFMAGLFDFSNLEGSKNVRVLDAGCGSGILSAAVVERLMAETDKSANLTLYETDVNIIPLLADNMEKIKRCFGSRFSYNIHSDNYILSQSEAFNHSNLFGDSQTAEYDLIIGNPPYKKISKDAPEAKAMPEVCHGAPNLYALFMSMGVFNLTHSGQLVYIIPRSWTSGSYFAYFRKYIFKHAHIEHIHLFDSRDKVFDRESVLQETMIVKLCKDRKHNDKIRITTTESNSDYSRLTTFDVPADIVVAGKDKYVYLATNEDDAKLLSVMNSMKYTLPDIGLRMRTGLVVDFRSRNLLRNHDEPKAVPLFYSKHISDGRVCFPAGKENEYIVTDRQGLLQANKNYLFVKRFTSKEEHRRLQCGIYLRRSLPGYDKISTQNKLNFIDSEREMSECTVSGLYVLFNSTPYDTYYRILNGSTQVNSTEVNSMPVPPLGIIEQMGRELIRSKDYSENKCNDIIKAYLQ